MNKKLLMVAGPTEIEDDVLSLGSEPQSYMRTPDYTKKLKNIFSNLQYVFQTSHPVIILSSSGTGAMEAAVTTIMSRNETALFVNGGGFGARWGEICKSHQVKTIEEKVKFGCSVDPERIRTVLENNSKIKVVFATLNETSSGAKSDIKAIGKITQEFENVFLVVDCVSGLISDEMKMDAWGVDIAISSSQKAIAIPPGLAFLAINERAIDKAKKSNLHTYYFNIFEYLKNWERNQTPFTPPVSLLNQLELRLQKIKNKGLENTRLCYLKQTLQIRAEIERLGLYTFAQSPANCITGVWVDDFSVKELVCIMRTKFHIELAPSGGDISDNFFRIGNMGNITSENISYFISCLEKTFIELRNK